jgi:histidinol-phosphate/aromatic aminotransferase/cobyric acid decarboxylase-like protein/choline kinase
MQAIILAAGMGSRLGKYTAHNTKCMLSINGKTLIERALDAINNADIRECIIVVGYKKEHVISFLGNRYKNINIRYISNDIYNKTNNIYSLYLTKELLVQDDVLLLESDLIFEERVITDMLAFTEPAVAAVARYESWMDGTVVQLKDTLIANFIPKKFFNYNEKETYYKTVNIYKFSKEFLRKTYIPFMEAYLQTMGNNEYYEQVLRVISTLDKNELTAFILNNHKWYEIDDVQDKSIAEIIFSGAPEKLSRIQKCYGGYWRFPGLIDFCYLVNPYFPSPKMLDEMKAYFNALISFYPSGLDTQNMLAGKLCNIDEDHIITGNGAAELIRALELEGGIGVIYPTFNEYPESLSKNKIIPFVPENFTYTKDDLLDFADSCDTMLLINPDNPSGNYIPKSGIIELLEKIKKLNESHERACGYVYKRLILDESFIDFSDIEKEPSLLKQEILDAYPFLVLIKSLSKSYGIPGIRLGILACGDKNFVKKIRKNLSIWNINSFAECFLQIIGKYQKDHEYSCKAIAVERSRFEEKLKETGLFYVHPSQANFILCKIHNNSAKELAEYLLDKNIFIKDLSGKKGVPDGSYIRLAVRNKADNDTLLEEVSRPCGAPPPSS